MRFGFATRSGGLFREVVAHPEWVLEDLAALVQSGSEGTRGCFTNLSDLHHNHEGLRLALLVMMIVALGLSRRVG